MIVSDAGVVVRIPLRSAHVDARLVQACDRHGRALAALGATHPASPGEEARASRHAYEEALCAIDRLTPHTLDGIVAKARSAWSEAQASREQSRLEDGRAVRWAWETVRHLLEMVAAGSTVHPDAELLATCAAIDELEEAYLATTFSHLPGSVEEEAARAERERLTDAQEPLIERAAAVRARTLEGQATRARSLALWAPDLLEARQEDVAGLLTAAILRDLVACLEGNEIHVGRRRRR